MKAETANRQKTAGLAAILAYIVGGVLLLIWPQLMTDITMWTLGIVLCVYGVYQSIVYFRTSPVEGAQTYLLATGLFGLTLGICVLADRTMFANIAPRIWGLMLLLGGFGKIQDAVDALRFKSGCWWWLLIGAAVSIVLGVLALTHPGFIRESIAVFIGISLLIEAVIDIVMMIMVKKQGKKN